MLEQLQFMVQAFRQLIWFALLSMVWGAICFSSCPGELDQRCSLLIVFNIPKEGHTEVWAHKTATTGPYDHHDGYVVAWLFPWRFTHSVLGMSFYPFFIMHYLCRLWLAWKLDLLTIG